jgi:hypothetical protein
MRGKSFKLLIEFDIPSILSAMAQNPMPELYLSLLSGRYSDVSHISTEQHHNNIGPHISGNPFCKDPNRLMDLLDAFAAVCVRREKGEVFFVSLAMDPHAATLYIYLPTRWYQPLLSPTSTKYGVSLRNSKQS